MESVSERWREEGMEVEGARKERKSEIGKGVGAAVERERVRKKLKWCGVEEGEEGRGQEQERVGNVLGKRREGWRKRGKDRE